MNPDHTTPSPKDTRVVQFRPRTGKTRVRRDDKPVFGNGEKNSPVRNFAKYHEPASRDDYRHRMTMNVIVLVFSCTLVMTGVWLALLMNPHS